MENYEILECLFQSNSSMVFKARCRKDLNLYVLKLFTEKINLAQKEIRMLKSMQIDFVVKYKGIFEVSQGLVLVMEYCDSGNLEHFIKEHMGNTISERVICQLMLQMVYILLYMHNKDIIHHDLTPENIFLTRTMKGEQLRLGDFGKSSVGSNNHQLPQQARYLPPEYLQEGIFNQKSQLWQLGLILYELACQKPFFSLDDNEETIKQKLTKGQLQVKIPSIYSRQLKRVIQLCLDADYQYRLQLRHIVNNPNFQAILKRNTFEFSFEQQAFLKEQIRIIMIDSGKRASIVTKDETFSPVSTQKQLSFPSPIKRGSFLPTQMPNNVLLSDFFRSNSKSKPQQFSVSSQGPEDEIVPQIVVETPRKEKKSSTPQINRANIINYNTPSQAQQVSRYKSMQQIKQFLNSQTPLTTITEPNKQKTITRFFRRPVTQVNVLRSSSDRKTRFAQNKSQTSEIEDALSKINNLIKEKISLCVQAVGEPQTKKLLQEAKQNITDAYQSPTIFKQYSSPIRREVLSHIKDITELDEEYKSLKFQVINFQ